MARFSPVDAMLGEGVERSPHFKQYVLSVWICDFVLHMIYVCWFGFLESNAVKGNRKRQNCQNDDPLKTKLSSKLKVLWTIDL